VIKKTDKKMHASPQIANKINFIVLRVKLAFPGIGCNRMRVFAFFAFCVARFPLGGKLQLAWRKGIAILNGVLSAESEELTSAELKTPSHRKANWHRKHPVPVASCTVAGLIQWTNQKQFV
jgi:hypothetical protein